MSFIIPTSMNRTPQFIPGGSHTDDRGTVSFANDFCLDNVKRLYHITHPDVNVVRAWQAHKVEQKWFYVVAGSFKIVVVQPDNWENPSSSLQSSEFCLNALNGVLYVPGGYANGFKALGANSAMIVFSDFTIEESAGDNYRFDKKLWYNWDKI